MKANPFFYFFLNMTNRYIKKVSLIIVLLILWGFSSHLYAYSQIPSYLCELGVKFYKEGKYEAALHEFKKALLIEPNYQPAIKYIQMIEQIGLEEEQPIDEFVPYSSQPYISSSQEPAGDRGELSDIQKEMIRLKRVRSKETIVSPAYVEPTSAKNISISLPAVLNLDDSFSKIAQPVEVEQGKSIIIAGRNIQRFLITEPNIIIVERIDANQLLVTGKEIGQTYFTVWDQNGRWTIEFSGVFPRPEGPTFEEVLRKGEERARNFILRYYLDWSSFELGRRVSDLKRSSYLWTHGLSLTGPTPYGNFDSSVTIRNLRNSTDLTYGTIGLLNGSIGPFKGFSLRAGDFYPYFSNLAFSGATLRGGMLTSPAFDNKINYTSFWGREGGGRYGNLSPGLVKTKNSFLDGFNVDFSPTTKQDYNFTLVHGWGRDRDDFLNPYNYDLSGSWKLLDKWGLGYEISQDSEHFAHLLKTKYRKTKLDFTAELRDISSKFSSATGHGWRQGELGSLFNVNYAPTDKLTFRSNLDVYRDRLFPAEDNKNRFNEDFDWEGRYQFNSDNSLGLTYNLQNELGRLLQYRYQNGGIIGNAKINFTRDIWAYFNYYHQENQSYSSPTSSYVNDKVYSGIRFSLIGQLYYYVNKEINWLQEKFYGGTAHPTALETGVDWSNQIGKSPFYGELRFTYRDEEDTDSNLGFLSGEDYIEGYTQLAYRPDGDKEIYGSCRVRNIWADKETVNKHLEADFNAGLRYLWDTGFRWEAVGNVEGYVFKDLNSDGLRQRDDPPVEGVKVWLGKDKWLVTDLFGYYKFKGVKARKAYATLDTSTLPAGFVLTVPVNQEIVIVNHRTSRADFGIISHSEITGYVFEDIDGDGKYNQGDKGVKGVIMTLENGVRSITDATGKYSFPNAVTGEYALTLDLSSLPVFYLPQAAVTKKIALFEGVTYIYNIPLKRIKE